MTLPPSENRNKHLHIFQHENVEGASCARYNWRHGCTRGRPGHQDTDGNAMRCDREGCQHGWALEHKKGFCNIVPSWRLRKTAMEHVLHETPDAGFVGGDCGKARDATEGIAANMGKNNLVQR